MKPNPTTMCAHAVARPLLHPWTGLHARPLLAGVTAVLCLLLAPRDALADGSVAPTAQAQPSGATTPPPTADLEVDLAAAMPASATDRDADTLAAPGPTTLTAATRRLSPMAAEMMAAMEHERASLAELLRRFRSAATRMAALSVQREIEQVKHETELTLLRIQADHARRAGLVEAAARIEAAIEEMTRPAASRLESRSATRAARSAPDGR